MALSFLEANNLVEQNHNFENREFVLATSFQTEKFEVFIKACAIQQGFNAVYELLPFNTLTQYIYQNVTATKQHVFLLLPWDLVPSANWRTGITGEQINIEELLGEAEQFLQQISRFQSFKIIYLSAPLPPMTRNSSEIAKLDLKLKVLATDYGATLLPGDYFALTAYLADGSPVSSQHLYPVAKTIIRSVLSATGIAKKVLVTDFDNVLWNGVIGEDGMEGINCSQDGAGYGHYIYQTYLSRLKMQGVLIAGVTRNDNETAHLPFKNKLTHLKEDDFVAILAGYNAKSSQINELSQQLNLPLDSFVFVDDNPIEIEEVKLQLPDVTCLTYPARVQDLLHLFDELGTLFDTNTITPDDSNKTEMYKARSLALENSAAPGAELSDYLQTLDMVVEVTICDSTNYHRALQLINKTNQFNLNSSRIDEDALLKILKSPGTKLYTFSLKDKFGEHGQVCSILLQDNNKISHFVMSCRVLQRKLEYYCLLHMLDDLKQTSLHLDYIKTDRNIPVQNFISESNAIKQDDGNIVVDIPEFRDEYHDVLSLFRLIQH